MAAKRRARTAPRLFLSTGLAIAAWAARPAPALAQDGFQPFLEVHKTASGYTVEAEDATLPQVLSALGKEAGFKVQDSGPARTAMPLFKVQDASLDATLRKLLGSENHLIVYRGGEKARIADGSIEKIILMSPVDKGQRADGQPASSLAGPVPGGAPSSRRGTATTTASRGIPQNDPGEPIPMPDPEEVLRQVPGLADPSQLPAGLEPRVADELARQRLEQLAIEGGDVSDPGAQPALPPGVLDQLESSGYTWDDQGRPVQ